MNTEIGISHFSMYGSHLSLIGGKSTTCMIHYIISLLTEHHHITYENEIDTLYYL